MTYVEATKFDGIVDVETDFDGFEEAMWKLINCHITDWLSNLRLEVHPYKGNLRIVPDIYLPDSDDEIVFEMSYEEFFQELNDEPPHMEEFLLAGLKYYRDIYDKAPGEPFTYDEED